MKIRVMSDVHCEFMRASRLWVESIVPEKDERVLVLAGDIAVKEIGEVLAQFCAQWPHVVYVPGNHEFYDSEVRETRWRIQRVVYNTANLHFLDCGTVTIEGQRFVGDTLWFPAPPPILPGERDPRLGMTDFHVIRGFEPWVYAQNEAAIRWLCENVRPDDVVVTHHLPSHRSVHARYTGDPLNRFFVGDSRLQLHGLMADPDGRGGPKLWVHGHTHDSLDYVISRTRIVCNPRGYEPHELNASFNPSFSVEV